MPQSEDRVRLETMMLHLVIVAEHQQPLRDERGGQLLVPAQVLPEPVAEEHRAAHRACALRARAPVARVQLVAAHVRQGVRHQDHRGRGSCGAATSYHQTRK